MKLLSKIAYQARIKGLDVTKSDGVKIKNSITGKYIHILPNGKICSDDLWGHDRALKCLMPDFLVKDPLLFSGSFISIPCEVTLYVGKETSREDINFAKGCLTQSFANVKNFKVIKDDDLLSHECHVKHDYALSYKERQALIKACLDYLL